MSRMPIELQWVAAVSKKYGDEMLLWPKMARRSGSQSIERLKDKLREEYKEVKFVAQKSECVLYEGMWFLHLRVIVECL